MQITVKLAAVSTLSQSRPVRVLCGVLWSSYCQHCHLLAKCNVLFAKQKFKHDPYRGGRQNVLWVKYDCGCQTLSRVVEPILACTSSWAVLCCQTNPIPSLPFMHYVCQTTSGPSQQLLSSRRSSVWHVGNRTAVQADRHCILRGGTHEGKPKYGHDQHLWHSQDINARTGEDPARWPTEQETK